MKYIVLGVIIFSIIFYIINRINRIPTQNQLSVHTAKALVITCMDFRLIDDVVYFLNSKGYNNNYDELILAGASLGYNQTNYEAWRETVDDHIRLSKKLHDIKEIIVIDHMDCGAYRIFYGKPKISREEEIELHKVNFGKFKELINKTYSDLKVSTYLMDINGKIINF